jgi:hypothetical protein
MSIYERIISLLNASMLHAIVRWGEKKSLTDAPLYTFASLSGTPSPKKKGCRQDVALK